jgi:hypothetical protein
VDLGLLWFGHVKEWKNKKTTKGIKVKRIKGRRPIRWSRTREFSQVLEDINKRGTAGHKLKRQD